MKSNTRSLVATAIPMVVEGDLEEPLLTPFDSLVERTTKTAGNEHHLIIKNVNVPIDDQVLHHVFRYFLMVGWTLGFLLQCVSLGGTAVMTLYWDEMPTSNEKMTSQILYWVLFGVANSWLLLFPVVCFAIERSWRTSGIRFLQIHLLEMEEPIITPQTRRMTFVASVRFLAGVVMGCFMAWGLVDLYLDASFSMVSTLVLSMMSCLILCKGMIVIYDSFST